MKATWACTICGPHPDSRSMWCGAGCGRDYNQMVPVLEEIDESDAEEVLGG